MSSRLLWPSLRAGLLHQVLRQHHESTNLRPRYLHEQLVEQRHRQNVLDSRFRPMLLLKLLRVIRFQVQIGV